jgi:hypothetical protein
MKKFVTAALVLAFSSLPVAAAPFEWTWENPLDGMRMAGGCATVKVAEGYTCTENQFGLPVVTKDADVSIPTVPVPIGVPGEFQRAFCRATQACAAS